MRTFYKCINNVFKIVEQIFIRLTFIYLKVFCLKIVNMLISLKDITNKYLF